MAALLRPLAQTGGTQGGSQLAGAGRVLRAQVAGSQQFLYVCGGHQVPGSRR